MHTTHIYTHMHCIHICEYICTSYTYVLYDAIIILTLAFLFNIFFLSSIHGAIYRSSLFILMNVYSILFLSTVSLPVLREYTVLQYTKHPLTHISSLCSIVSLETKDVMNICVIKNFQVVIRLHR